MPLLGICAHDTTRHPFSLPPDVWDTYVKGRPTYPDSMWHKWLDYQKLNGPLDTIHEIGTGCGVGAAALLRVASERGQEVRKCILSDPSESNVQTTRTVLTAERFPGVALEFHRRMGEESFLPPGSVDMVVACESIHWTAIEQAMESIWACLRPGGTFAAVHYLTTAQVIDNDEIREKLAAAAAWKRQRNEELDRELHGHEGDGSPNYRPSQLGVGLDFVPMDGDKWEDVRRTWYNFDEGSTEWPDSGRWRDKRGAGAKDKASSSRVAPGREMLRWVQDDGWGLEKCTVERIKQLWNSSVAGPVDAALLECEPWREFEAAVDKAGGHFKIRFWATTLLGRKKG